MEKGEFRDKARRDGICLRPRWGRIHGRPKREGEAALCQVRLVPSRIEDNGGWV